MEEGEKNTKYFLNLEKRNYNTTYIKKLIGKNNENITDLENIIKEQESYYRELYTSKHNESENNELLSEFTNAKIPELSSIDREICDEKLNIEEIGKALRNLENNKTPGSDGLTTNFYKFFWVDIKSFLFESYSYSYENMSLTQNQKLGILNLLPKKAKI